MTPTRRQEIERMYHATLEHPQADRAAFLATVSQDDPELRREVESMIARSTAGITATLQGPGSQLGPYRIETRLGAGGMGEVFRAVDTRLGRPVAIKISHEQYSDRFSREARLISSLSHPHICTLYDVGPNYLVMELCEGETLASRLKRGKLSMEETVRYGAQIADALAAAHSNGIVHRDLKPHNIMVGKPGVKVLDFGLAKSQSDDTLTASQMIVGTPAYMAPEQRQGNECDARTDIYALGLVLYEMAAGKRLEPGQMLPVDLFPEKVAHIIERCLEPERDNRWQSAKDVSAELRWGAPSRSRAEPKPGRKSHSVLLYSGISLLVGALMASAWFVFMHSRVRSGGGSLPAGASLLTIANYTGTERSGAVSPDGKSFAFVSSRNGSPDIWVRQVSGGSPVQITHDDAQEQDLVYAPDGDSIYYVTGVRPSTIQRVGVLGGASRKVTVDARYPSPSPDGKYLAYATNVTGGQYAAAIMVSDADGGGPQLVKDKLSVRSLSWSLDGKWLAYANGTLLSNQTIAAIDPQGKQTRTLQSFPGGVPYGIAWAPDSRSIVYSFDSRPLVGNADIWIKPLAGDAARRLTLNPRGSFRSISVTRDGKRLLATMDDTDFEVWKVPLDANPTGNAAAARLILDSGWQPMWIQTSRTGSLLFNSPATGERNLWSMPLDNSTEPRQITFLPGGHISHAALSADSTQVAFVSVASGNGQIYVANADGSEFRQLTSDNTAKVWPFWSPDGQWIMFAAGRQLWKVPSKGGPAEQFTRDGGLRGDWSPTGNRIVYDVNGDTVRIAESSSGKVLHEIKGLGLISPIWAPDGKRISAHGPGSVWIVNPDTGEARLAVQFPEGHRFNFRAAWTSDGKSVVVNKVTSKSRIVLLENFE